VMGEGEMIRVAVYGTLRGGCPNSYLLAESEKVGESVMHGYELRSNGFYPYACINVESTIVVEVYEVSEKTLERLDMLEGTPHHYIRVSESLILNSMPDKAWIYVVADEERVLHLPKVPGGDWMLAIA